MCLPILEGPQKKKKIQMIKENLVDRSLEIHHKNLRSGEEDKERNRLTTNIWACINLAIAVLYLVLKEQDVYVSTWLGHKELFLDVPVSFDVWNMIQTLAVWAEPQSCLGWSFNLMSSRFRFHTTGSWKFKVLHTQAKLHHWFARALVYRNKVIGLSAPTITWASFSG